MDPSAFPEREKEDAYHFVAYLPVNDILYELDGLRRSPIMHAPVEDDWLNTARETIEQRIATYPAGSVSLILDSFIIWQPLTTISSCSTFSASDLLPFHDLNGSSTTPQPPPSKSLSSKINSNTNATSPKRVPWKIL